MAISDRKKREKEQRKQSIIDAAEKLFFEKGYDNVTMNDIAKEVELNRATIYLYFENKEAVCFAVILQGVRILNGMAKNQVKRATYTQKINALGRAYDVFFNLYPQYIQVYSLFQSGKFDLSSLRRPAWDDVQEIIKLQKEIFNILLSAIKTEKGAGTILPDVDPVYTTILIISAIESMLSPSPLLEKEIKDMNLNKYHGFNRDFMYFVNQLIKNK